MLSYIKPLEGLGIRLCVKDYKNAAFLENISSLLVQGLSLYNLGGIVSKTQDVGMKDACQMLAKRSAELILKEWNAYGHVHENYDPETGEGCNNARSDKFYHWGGLLAYLSLC